MKPRHVALCAAAAAILLAGCATDPGATAAEDGAVYGYQYHDGAHPNYVTAQPSPQAIENARRGVWLWPPAAVGRKS